MSDTEATNWWQKFYDDTPFELVLDHRSAAEEAATTEFLTKQLQLRPGFVVFDQCCGTGSVSVPLAQQGVSVIGVDACGKYIESANTRFQNDGLPGSFYHGDAFEFVPEASCGAAFNWYTSFGYAPTDAQNRRMLERAFESLKPGGRFAIDIPNAPLILRHFREQIVRQIPSEHGDISLVRECRINLAAGTMEQRWTYTFPDGQEVQRDSVLRLYMPHDLVAMLTEVGFVDVELFGDINGEPMTLDSPRCLCVARKPD